MKEEFTVVLDPIRDLRSGPYAFDVTSPVRLHCRIGRIRVHIEDIEVQDYDRHARIGEAGRVRQWRIISDRGWGHDHLVWHITDLIRARYDTPEKQAWLRNVAERREEDDLETENEGGD